MSDDMMKNGEEPVFPEGSVAPPPAPPMIKKGAASRNILLFVAGGIVLVVLVVLVGYAIMIAGNISTPGTGVVVTPGAPGAPGAPSAPSTSPTAGLLPVADIDDRDIFTPRNPFEPLDPVSIYVAPAKSDDGTTTPSTSVTLSLVSIDASATPYTAVVKLGASRYTVAAGDMVSTSLWHIDDITKTELFATYDNGTQQLFSLP